MDPEWRAVRVGNGIWRVQGHPKVSGGACGTFFLIYSSVWQHFLSQPWTGKSCGWALIDSKKKASQIGRILVSDLNAQSRSDQCNCHALLSGGD